MRNKSKRTEKDLSDSMVNNQQLSAKNQEMTVSNSTWTIHLYSLAVCVDSVLIFYLITYIQTTASQWAVELKQLKDKIGDLERRLRHTTTLKEKAETELQISQRGAAETKVIYSIL